MLAIVERLGEVVLARAEVDPIWPVSAYWRDEAVDGVGEPALLADLLEEARGGRAAEDRVEHRGGEAARVGTRDAGGAEADVVLLGVLALEAQRRRGRRAQRARAPVAAARGAAAAVDGALDSSTSASWSMLPAAATTMFGGPVEGAVVGGEGAPADRRDHLGAADHAPPERMVAEDRLAEQVVDEILRRVLVHRDLLEHDLALGVEVVEARREDHVAHHLERQLDVVSGTRE